MTLIERLGELWCSGLFELRGDLTFQAPGLGQDLLSGRLRESEQEIGVFEGREPCEAVLTVEDDVGIAWKQLVPQTHSGLAVSFRSLDLPQQVELE